MKYGYFDDSRREYVIENPSTPWPWINYLGNHDFFSLVSNTAGGYSFYKDARYRRLTRYRYNNVPMDNGGRYFYIKDGNTVWSPGWKPLKTELEKYECRHGLGYTMITGVKNKVEAELLLFVPLGSRVELQRIRIKNNSHDVKSLKLFSFLEWNLWNAEDDQNNLQRNLSTGEVEVDGSTIYHKTEYRERRNHYAFYHVNSKVDGFDTDRESFVGLYNELSYPETVAAGKARNSIAHGWSPVASHYLEIELRPGESRELIFMLGYVENPEEEKWESKGVVNKKPAKQMIARFDNSIKLQEAFDELRSYWDDLLGNFSISSNDKRLDRMVNIWNQYQCMVTFNMSRSASYFEVGIGRGMGFRDSNQDLIGFVHQVPERARERIIDIASTQFETGGAYHQYQPLTKRGNNAIGGDFNDDPLWLILSTTEYIKETGDFSILEETVPFDNDISNQASLFEHLKRSFYFTVNNLGPHGLPLIGRADWNDCLNLNCFSSDPNESFQTTGNKSGGVAESLMIAGLFVVYGREFAGLCREIDLPDEAGKATVHVNNMVESIKEHGWDGNWFLRAYDYYGNKVGSHSNDEGKIFIESQGWCTMAEIGKDEGMCSRALDSVKELLDTPYGIVLNTPAFTKYYIEYGEISTYPPGYKENAGIFCHNNPWIMIGEAIRGRADRAWDYYRKITPAYLEDISELHKTEPYVYSQMIAGKDANKPGEAKNSWLTGTAAWNYYAVSRYMLGIQPEYKGLRPDPCLPDDINELVIKRRFRGAEYTFQIIRGSKQKGVKKLVVNGKTLESNLVPVMEKGTDNHIEVHML